MLRGVLFPCLLLVLLGLWFYDPDTPKQATARVQTTTVQSVNPNRLTVVDGDTVRLAGETIRLVGFDTPETYRAQCDAERARGDAATERLRELLARASSARLAYLPRRDQYGRDLAQLMLDGQDVADVMVREGLARRYSGGHRQSWC
ncbi:Thermonuclease [Sulfitobacter noctilucae]|nr:Thermonuclease [Sulfitobacter noctilucae]